MFKFITKSDPLGKSLSSFIFVYFLLRFAGDSVIKKKIFLIGFEKVFLIAVIGILVFIK